MIRFDDQVAIVTGAAVGLGRAHAHLLAARGAHVVVNDLDQKAADQVAAEITQHGGSAFGIGASVADPSDVARVIEATLNRFGRIDALVNNAGILRDKSFKRMADEDFELVLRVHLFGTYYMAKAVWPLMLKQKFGRVVLTASSSGLATAFGQANYGAAKAAMIGLMNSLKNEGKRDNVLVNAISPVAATQMTEGLLGERLAEISFPEHVSPAVAFLCSKDCAETGQIIAAGAGHFARVQMMKSPGVVIDPDRAATIEEFAAAKGDILSLAGAAEYVGTFDPATKERLGL